MMEPLLINAVTALRELNMEQLRTQLPNDLSDAQIRTLLIHHALTYAQAGDLAECGMKVHVGQPWPDFGLCVIEVVDEEIRQKFGYEQYYVFKGCGLHSVAEAVPYDSPQAAYNGYYAEQNS